MVTERTDILLGAEIFAVCKKKAKSIPELTKEIYGNKYAKNIYRVYCVTEILMSNELIVPIFKNKILRFKVNINHEILKE